jgi:hypothetical protein
MVVSKIDNNGVNLGQLGNRNKVLNGAMSLDQRNAGVEVSPAPSGYGLDRWATFKGGAGTWKLQQSTDAPAGFKNSALLTVTSASTPSGNDYYILLQHVEGNNVVDLSFGSASAKTVTLSFWVKSSVTGTFGGSLRNSAADRSYPFTYSVSSAGVWEQKSVSVVGDTIGTWLTTNGRGLSLGFSLGGAGTELGTAGAWAATNNTGATGQTNWIATAAATFQITGVQLEVGDTATPFEHRSYAQELALCMRYYQKDTTYVQGYQATPFDLTVMYRHPVDMRASPTSAWLGDPSIQVNVNNAFLSAVPSGDGAKQTRIYYDPTATGSMEYNRAFSLDAEL